MGGGTRGKRRILVIGGDAAGMSAAATAKRRIGDDADVVVLEAGRWTSYSACGIPYWVGGEVAAADDLVARTPQEHRERGIDVRLGAEALAIDPDAATVRVREADGGDRSYGYDDLLVATGAEPASLDVPGNDAAGIHLVHTLDDGARILADLAQRPVRRAVVVGGGYIGVEIAESCVHKGIQTTVLTRSATPMTSLDPDMGLRVRDAMDSAGIDLRCSTTATGFRTDDGHVTGVETADGVIDADVVFVGVGVRPRAALAADAGLPIGTSGAIRVDGRQRVDADRRIWAAGDCAESYHRLSREQVHIPLGTHANKQGLVAGRNLAGDDLAFPGVLGTAITKVCDTEIARTGLGEQQANDSGYDPVATTIETTTRAGYYPGADPMSVKLIGDRISRRLLGVQIVGGQRAAKRVDAVATALWAGLSVEDLLFADLAYAPPFSGVWDPVQVAARALTSRLG